MRSRSDHDVHLDPAFYGLDLVRRRGITTPPVSEYAMADFHGYEIKEIYPKEHFKAHPQLRQIFRQADAHLIPSANLILVNGDDPYMKKRTAVFHELGHSIIPWHMRLNYHCANYRFDDRTHRRYKREVSRCGAEIQMPSDLFIPDALALEPGIEAIRQLSRRYHASLETTAIRYVETSPTPCAMVIIESRDDRYGQLDLWSAKPNGRFAPLKIKYAIRSSRFRLNIRSGTKIGVDTPIYDAWASRLPSRVELPSSMLGIQSPGAYNADILPQGKIGKVMVFLWSYSSLGDES